MNAKPTETDFSYLYQMFIFLLERGSELASIRDWLIGITDSEVDFSCSSPFNSKTFKKVNYKVGYIGSYIIILQLDCHTSSFI